MSRPVIITDYSCTPRICGALPEELWPVEDERPVVLSIPVSIPGSDAHERWVKTFQDAHGGEFLKPFIEQHHVDPTGPIGLIGFSAGGWGIGQIIKNSGDADAVGMLYVVDGMHGGWKSAQPSYAERAKGETWKAAKVGQHWIDFASSAARGERMMVASYSKILPPTYPGTRETALALAADVGAFPTAIDIGMPVWEQNGIGSLFLLGVNPPNHPSDGPEAHIFQANQVQEAVWRSLFEAWTRGYNLTATSMAIQGGVV